jgi:hypothetical protein
MRPDLQDLWIEHVGNVWSGAYASKDGGEQTGAKALAAQAAWIERQGGTA